MRRGRGVGPRCWSRWRRAPAATFPCLEGVVRWFATATTYERVEATPATPRREVVSPHGPKLALYLYFGYFLIMILFVHT